MHPHWGLIFSLAAVPFWPAVAIAAWLLALDSRGLYRALPGPTHFSDFELRFMDRTEGKSGGRTAEYVPLATFYLENCNEPDDASANLMPDTRRPLAGSRKSWASILHKLTHPAVQTFNNNTGLFLIALSQGFASLMGVFVKKLNQLDPPVHPLELIWIRMVMTWMVCVGYMSMTKVPDSVLGPKGIRFMLAFRGFSGFFGLFGTYYALQYLSLSDVTVLSFLTPMCTAITGALILKETLTFKHILASVFSFAGVVLIARPEFLFGHQAQDTQDDGGGTKRFNTSAQRLGAVGVALLGVVGLTSAYTTIRAIGKRAHAMHNLGAFSALCIITAPIAMAVSRTPVVVPDNLPCFLMILGVIASGFGAQVTMTTGLQRETAGRGTMAIYVQVIFALLFERIFFHTTPPPLSLVGTAIILSSAIYIALSKQKASQSSDESRTLEETSLEEGLLANDHDGDGDSLADASDVTDEHELGDIKLDVQGSQEKFAIGSSASLVHHSSSSESKSVSSIEGI